MEVTSSNGLLFIGVDEKSISVIVKNERSPSPEDLLIPSAQIEVNTEKEVNDEKLQCAECSHYTTSSAERMTRHIRRVHRGENPFQCTMCDYSTYNSVLFQEHVNIHQGIKPYKCQYCPYRSVSKKYIKLHEQKHGTCTQCGFLADSRPALKRHRRENGCAADKNKKIFTCNACGSSYDTYSSLLQHRKRFKDCPHCEKRFCVAALAVHLTSVHGIVPEKAQKSNPKKLKFQCAQCKWASSNTQKILLHMIHHPAQRLDGSIDITPLVRTGILKLDVQ